MRRALILITIFIVVTIITSDSCPIINLWDRNLILFLQKVLKDVPLWIPLLPDCKLYTVMIVLPIIVCSAWFYRKKLYINILYFCSVPLITFLLNCIIKPLVHRSRPPYELQLNIHPHSFSYVSSHSLVTICLWGTVIYLLNKYCSNTIQKWFCIIFAVLWILFVGISRIWLGVHYPTDVIGAYILGLLLLSGYVYLIKRGTNNE